MGFKPRPFRLDSKSSKPSSQANQALMKTIEDRHYIWVESTLAYTAHENCQNPCLVTEHLTHTQAKEVLNSLIAPQLRPITQADFERVFRFLMFGKVGEYVEFANIHFWIRVK